MTRALLPLLGLLLFAPAARASTTFPEALRKELGLTEIVGPGPGCQLCHRDDAGGVKTAIKPLGRSLLAAGAQGGSVPSLLDALKTLEQNGTDSDRDGAGDVSELRAGSNPNVFDVVEGGAGASGMEGMPCPVILPLPETGCSLRSGATPGGTGFTLSCVALLALVRRRARRRA
jgi:hypothetical protein